MTTTNTIAATPAEAIRSRRSVRAFLPKPVPRQTVETILDIAKNAPNGSNIQPWQVFVVHGKRRDALCAEILAADNSNPQNYSEEYQYYPTEWVEPYLGRRRQL